MKTIRDKWPYVISIAASLFLGFWAYGCQSETKSLIEPTKKVTRPELLDEIDSLIQKFDTAISELDRQDKFRNMVLQQSMQIAESGTVNPVGVVTTILALLGAGASADNIRLRKQRKNVDQNIRANST